jgi:hypothetical protein
LMTTIAYVWNQGTEIKKQKQKNPYESYCQTVCQLNYCMQNMIMATKIFSKYVLYRMIRARPPGTI